jgi:hypothetical protein
VDGLLHKPEIHATKHALASSLAMKVECAECFSHQSFPQSLPNLARARRAALPFLGRQPQSSAQHSMEPMSHVFPMGAKVLAVLFHPTIQPTSAYAAAARAQQFAH